MEGFIDIKGTVVGVVWLSVRICAFYFDDIFTCFICLLKKNENVFGDNMEYYGVLRHVTCIDCNCNISKHAGRLDPEFYYIRHIKKNFLVEFCLLVVQ